MYMCMRKCVCVRVCLYVSVLGEDMSLPVLSPTTHTHYVAGF